MNMDMKEYSKLRDEVIVKCWEMGNTSPLDSFIHDTRDLHNKEFIDKWEQANDDLKMLTLCEMTFCARKKVKKYQDKALEWIMDYKERKDNVSNEQYEKDNVSNEQYEPVELLVKDLKPKYKWMEVVMMDSEGCMTIPYNKLVKLERVIKDFSNREVLSIKEYNDTKTTSIVISDK